MANSKANIYPIQLQGAELNLNKYDAEIKQYSGFNKNNSPFVGGCLANVFTKDEHLDAETESMYIDTNGDVYHVDNEGLWKNGQNILFLPEENRNFIECEEIKTPYENVLRVFEDGYILHEENGKVKINEYEIGSYNYEYTREQNAYNFVTAAKVSIRSTERPEIFLVVWMGENPSITSFYNGEKIDSKKVNNFSTHLAKTGAPSIVSQTQEAELTYMDYFWLVIPCMGVQQIKISFLNHGQHGKIWDDITGDVITQGQFYNSTYNLLCDDFTSVIGLNYPYSLLYCLRCTKTTTTNIHAASRFKIRSYELVNDNYVLYLDFSLGPQLVRLQADADNSDSWLDYYLEKFTFTPFILNYVSQVKGQVVTSVEACHKVNSFTCENTGAYLYKIETINNLFKVLEVGGEIYNLGNTFENLDFLNYLFSQNKFLGIAGNYCLLTDWNSVEVRSVYPSNGEQCLYFCSYNKWYKIKKGNPKIRKIGNQIIINADFYNSYDIEKKEILLFAPNFAYDLRLKKAPYYYNFVTAFYIKENLTNNKWVGAARNEYNQGLNPSIILNPVNYVSYKEFNSNNNYAYEDVETKVMPSQKYYIDLFEDINSSTEVIYSITRSSYREYKNSDLTNLPFPTQTDGNVQYSPCLFSKIESQFGNQAFIKSGNTFYPLAMGNNNEAIMAYFLASGVENLDKGFIIQGQFYGLLNNGIYSLQFSNGVVTDVHFIVDIANMQYVGNTPYIAIFFSKTNRCLYAFTGANVLNKLQFVDKISEIKEYGYNPTTQTNILITDIGVIMLSSFGTFLLEYTDIVGFYLQDEGICLYNDSGDYHFIKYYKTENDGYTKQNIRLETCFYGMNNQTVTINDCLYVRLFSEEHESGDVEMTASTLSNYGRTTEKTTFKIKSSDWDKMTHSIYLRYQPKEQRGLGVSFSINSPFKIAALSVGSQPDAILIDKVSKTAINAPQRTTNNSEW